MVEAPKLILKIENIKKHYWMLQYHIIDQNSFLGQENKSSYSL